MKYPLIDLKYTSNYVNSYKNAIVENKESECFIGHEEKYRMNAKDSIITKLTDPRVLLEYCIYPLFSMGDKEIAIRINRIIKDMVKSKDIINIYQVVRFIYAQDKLEKKYDELLLVVDVMEVVPDLFKMVDELRDEMKMFSEGEFALFPQNIYEMIHGMIKKSKSFSENI